MNHIDVAALNTILMETPAVVVIDVRSRDEYMMAHIPQATNIPLDLILADTEKALNQINDLVPQGQDTIYIVCLSDRRSFMACTQLHQAGLTNTCFIRGGTHAWMQAGYPVNSGT